MERQRRSATTDKFCTLFEIFWAIQAQQGMEYSVWLKMTEEVFAARKRLRDFPGQNKPGEKSAISGIREVLCNEDGVNSFWEKIAKDHSAKDIDPQGKEHLDAVDVIRRFAMVAMPEKKPFPSTSSIATAPFVENLYCLSRRKGA